MQAAFGFLLVGFAVSFWPLQFNTLHSSFAIAFPVLFVPQIVCHLSLSALLFDDDDTMLVVVFLRQFVVKHMCFRIRRRTLHVSNITIIGVAIAVVD